MEPLTQATASQDRLDALIEQNMGLVVLLAKSFNPRDEDELDEFIQLGRIGLWKAIENHDPSRSKLSTTAWHYIKWEILRELGKRKRGGHIQFDETLMSPENDLSGHSAYVPTENIWDYVPDSLSEKELEVVRLRLEGHSFIDIGKEMGYSRGWANNTFRAALEKISDANAKEKEDSTV